MAAKDELFDKFMDREEESLNVTLVATATRTAVTIDEFIRLARLQGMGDVAIREVMLTDLRTNGRIFGEFNRQIRATVNGSVNRLRDDALYAEEGVITKYRWVAILVNTCPDCMDRHGVEKTWEAWESSGLPRTNQTVCKQFCNCMLIPSAVTDLEKVEPIMRGKK